METESSTVTKHRATHYIVGNYNGEQLKIIYIKDLNVGLQNYIKLHHLNERITGTSIDQITELCKKINANLSIYTSVNATIKKEIVRVENPITEGLNILQFRNELFVIKSISKQNKCENCGTTYSKIHNCNYRKREYYHHIINKDTRNWWELIKFFPIGSCENTKRLYIVYDIETFTQHTKYGKQLVPYLLAFTMFGDKKLLSTAEKIATDLNFIATDNCYFLLSSGKDVIGRQFKQFRLNIQKEFAIAVWKKFAKQHNIEADISYEDIIELNKNNKLNKSKKPTFVEIIVIGHNITAFDEIVLANHVIEGLNDYDAFKMFEIRRNFMPRAGKLLFNDISLNLPNPSYEKPNTNTFQQWRSGIVDSSTMKVQGLKFMVRDTFLMTHCSLRTAAQAYQLPIAKGHCPYAAVNEFFMLGKYEKEENGYPARKYWASEKEYLENKPEAGKTYDIISESIKYCIDDVKVTSLLTQKLVEGYKLFCENEINLPCNFHVFQRPTISSNTHAIFKQIHYRDNNGTKDYLPNLQAPSEKMYDHIRQSIRGGRCYPSFIGVFEEPIFVYDICGMYASALTHPMPYGRTEDPFTASISINNFQKILETNDKISYFDNKIKPMIVQADCEPPPVEMLDVLPPMCSRKGGRLCWTNEPLHAETMTTIDLITLHNRGWKCKINTNSDIYAVWPEWKCICKNYVSINIKAKEKAEKEKNLTQRSISKLLSNSLYGSFATRLDNKKVVFDRDINDVDLNKLLTGKAEITAHTTVICSSLPRTDFTKTKQLFNLPDCTSKDTIHQNENFENSLTQQAFIGADNHVIFNPITFLEASCDDLLISVIEDNSEWITNNKYPSQIASFVLAWTRAFTSEWADILYSDDRGKNYIDRTIKSIYGDTDSLFLTKDGHERMLTVGKHRLKRNGGKLIFDEDNPDLTWLVECETMCNTCGKDAYATESVYLAPKLYALKDIHCDNCNTTQPGKLRAKGHAKECINYDVMKQCFTEYDLLEQPTKDFSTRRMTMKRTLNMGNQKSKPFTVMEKQLTRILRPWNDMTMWKLTQYSNGYLLCPYDKTNPNPRLADQLIENPFWENT
nr:polymerase [Tern adenovirus]